MPMRSPRLPRASDPPRSSRSPSPSTPYPNQASVVLLRSGHGAPGADASVRGRERGSAHQSFDIPMVVVGRRKQSPSALTHNLLDLGGQIGARSNYERFNVRSALSASSRPGAPVTSCGPRNPSGVDGAETNLTAELAPHASEEQPRRSWVFGGPSIGERHSIRAEAAQVPHEAL